MCLSPARDLFVPLHNETTAQTVHLEMALQAGCSQCSWPCPNSAGEDGKGKWKGNKAACLVCEEQASPSMTCIVSRCPGSWRARAHSHVSKDRVKGKERMAKDDDNI